jgi:hypothetical protein
VTVRELVAELLEFNLDASVDIDVNTSVEDINESEFSFHDDNRYLTLVLEPKNHVLVDKKEYEDLTEEIKEFRRK